MATFNQQGQTVGRQINAETINFNDVKNPEDYLQQLRNLQAALDRAVREKAIEAEAGIDARSHVKKAILEAESGQPDKKTLIQHLAEAKDLVTGVDSLIVALTAAITTVGTFF